MQYSPTPAHRRGNFFRPVLFSFEDRYLPGSLLSYALALTPPFGELLFTNGPVLLTPIETTSSRSVASTRANNADFGNRLAASELPQAVPAVAVTDDPSSTAGAASPSLTWPFSNSELPTSLLDADLLELLAGPSSRPALQIRPVSVTPADGTAAAQNRAGTPTEPSAGAAGSAGSAGNAANIESGSRTGPSFSTGQTDPVRSSGELSPTRSATQRGGSASRPQAQFTTLNDPTVSSVVYLPTGPQGTTGDLDPNNPNGAGGTPAFGGGYRFFPDAQSFASRTESRNIVRIRATIAPAMAGVTVYFRSFDVDDPSADATIDANGNNGRDNLGKAIGPALQTPASAGADGYRGQLRLVQDVFAAEGGIVGALTQINALGQAVAEVELATSFNPGDNYRVVASTDLQALQNLNDTTHVPTTGAVTVPNFPGMAAEQLSVWRRLHVEQDRMAAIPFGQRATGHIIGVLPNGFPNPALSTEALVTLDFQIPVANRFVGGNLRAANGKQYQIVSHNTNNPSTVTVRIPTEVIPGYPIPPAAGAVELAVGDFQRGAHGDFETEGQITAVGIPAGGQLELTTTYTITAADEYAGGVLRTGGENYPILGNTAGANAHFIINSGSLTDLPLGSVEVYRGEYEQARITLVSIPAGGQLELTTDLYIEKAGEYTGGVLRTGGQNYPILSHTQGEHARITIDSGTLTDLPLDDVEIYQDDYVSVEPGDQPPIPRIAQPSDASYYDFLEVSTVRVLNRYADAYIEPEYNALNAYDSNDVTPVGHFGNVGSQYANVADPYRGTSPGQPARPANYETPVFWVVYVLAGYEDWFLTDYDGDLEGATLGATNSIPGQVDSGGEVSVIFTESIRDATTSTGLLTEAEARARTAVHEIGHQFDVANGPNTAGEHRGPPDFPPNIMSSVTSLVPAGQFYFHPADVLYLRKRVQSPGTHPAF